MDYDESLAYPFNSPSKAPDGYVWVEREIRHIHELPSALDDAFAEIRKAGEGLTNLQFRLDGDYDSSVSIEVFGLRKATEEDRAEMDRRRTAGLRAKESREQFLAQEAALFAEARQANADLVTARNAEHPDRMGTLKPLPRR